jgi:hypothetical protein
MGARMNPKARRNLLEKHIQKARLKRQKIGKVIQL